MKPFLFRWQRILRLAEGFESESKNTLAQAIGNLNRAEVVRDELIRRKKHQKILRSRLLNEGTDITHLKNAYQGEVEIEYKLGAVDETIVSCEGNIDECRQDLAEKMRERKTYEILRTKAHDIHTSEMKREESREVDEVATISFGRTEENDII